ncbi:MAG: HDIG domain-containing protein [Chloroflexi bacterium]|nr:HDIG domain-containing protein [Chloroflexota bacterium]
MLKTPTQAGSVLLSTIRRATWPQRLVILLWGLTLWGALTLVLVYQFLPSRVRLQAGEVSTQDIRAPQRITYVSELRTTHERDVAEGSVTPIYTPPDRLLTQRQINRARAIAAYLNVVRQDPYASADEKRALISAIQDVQFSSKTTDLILKMTESSWQTITEQVVIVLEQIMREEIREDRLDSVRRQVPIYIAVNLTSDQAQVINEWVQGLIRPNSFLDEEKTQVARDSARQAVEPVRITLEKGQIIVREGEVVSELDVEALQALGLQQVETSWSSVLSALFFVLLLVLILNLYIARRRSDVWNDGRLAVLLWVLIVSYTLAAKLAIPGNAVLPYLIPAAIVSMLLASLVGPDLALVVTMVLTLLVGYISGGSLELIVYAFSSAALAALMVWRVDRLNTFVWTGVTVSLANLAVVMTFGLINPNSDVTTLLSLAVASLASGGIAASLTLAGFFVLGNLLQITTFLQLMELSRPTHPLLQRLLMKAPGTYHHTILVGNLTERAAQAIGADPLLARVGAYYHDIGKTLQPYYFTENQTDGVNIHDRLDPKTSAQIITSHVTEGVKLAEKYGLPKAIIDFIPQHHGTRLATYFYYEACKKLGEENVDKASYRYPGPKPQTRETAILMLADSVQAISQGKPPASIEQTDQIVRGVINERLAEGQLDECNLTLRDLSRIRHSFVDVLQSMYHERIKYPVSESPSLLPEPLSPNLEEPDETEDKENNHASKDNGADQSPPDRPGK